jgi:hypothetical protein
MFAVTAMNPVRACAALTGPTIAAPRAIPSNEAPEHIPRRAQLGRWLQAHAGQPPAVGQAALAADRLAEGTVRLPSARLTVAGQWRALGPLLSACFYSSPDLIELAFRTPSDGICNPAVKIRFMPAAPVGADFELSRKRTLDDLAVDGGPGQPGPSKNGFQSDDPVWFTHGRAAPCSLFLTASGTRQDGPCGRARAFC